MTARTGNVVISDARPKKRDYELRVLPFGRGIVRRGSGSGLRAGSCVRGWLVARQGARLNRSTSGRRALLRYVRLAVGHTLLSYMRLAMHCRLRADVRLARRGRAHAGRMARLGTALRVRGRGRSGDSIRFGTV